MNLYEQVEAAYLEAVEISLQTHKKTLNEQKASINKVTKTAKC